MEGGREKEKKKRMEKEIGQDIQRARNKHWHKNSITKNSISFVRITSSITGSHIYIRVGNMNQIDYVTIHSFFFMHSLIFITQSVFVHRKNIVSYK
jgi:hypothetical protein